MIKYMKGNSDQMATVTHVEEKGKKEDDILLLVVGVDFIFINEKYDCCNEQINTSGDISK